MFVDLPEHLQHQILYYLESDNFPAAKELRDQWLLNEQHGKPNHHTHEEV